MSFRLALRRRAVSAQLQHYAIPASSNTLEEHRAARLSSTVWRCDIVLYVLLGAALCQSRLMPCHVGEKSGAAVSAQLQHDTTPAGGNTFEADAVSRGREVWRDGVALCLRSCSMIPSLPAVKHV